MSAMISSPLPTPLAGERAFDAPLGFLTRVAALAHAHRDRLLAYARRRGLDAEDALDVVQDSFISFLLAPSGINRRRKRGFTQAADGDFTPSHSES
jgi:hypothetical protein